MAISKKVKLGKKASSFFDAVTRLKVLPGQVVKVTAEQAKSEKFKTAMANRWLDEATESDLAKSKSSAKKAEEVEESEENGFNKYTIAELHAYIQENYELEEEELEEAKSLKKAELVAFVEQLENEDEE